MRNSIVASLFCTKGDPNVCSETCGFGNDYTYRGYGVDFWRCYNCFPHDSDVSDVDV